MTLYHRLRRWLGHDTTVEIEGEYPVYEYSVHHLNGETTKAVGNGHKRDEGFVIVTEADTATWALLTAIQPHHSLAPCKPWSGRGMDTVKELEGVQEVERERIGTDVFTLTIERATNSIVNVEKDRQT